MIDIQSSQSIVAMYLDQVGIKGLKHPISIKLNNGTIQHSIADFTMTVGLPADQRGTHMSRFVEVLNSKSWTLSVPNIQELLLETAQRFKTDNVSISANFTMFINKFAPVSKVAGLLDYQASFTGKFITNKNQTHNNIITMAVTVPITTLCPCSKEISDYGAHSQRSCVKIEITTAEDVYFEDLITLVEQEASCEIYSVLKRADEKYVTERAYNNPRFVEDIVRNIARKLVTSDKFKPISYKIESENYESIHNHSAYAVITSP